ncbi:MAG: RDD family protein [Armatimonadota bacterium]
MERREFTNEFKIEAVKLMDRGESTIVLLFIMLYIINLLSYMTLGKHNLNSISLSLYTPDDLKPLPAVFGFILLAFYGLPIVIDMALFALYALISIRFWSATPGMIVAGLVLVTENQEKITLFRAFIRHVVSYFSGAAFFIGYLWSLFDREGRTWHDILSGTRVVNRARVQQIDNI